MRAAIVAVVMIASSTIPAMAEENNPNEEAALAELSACVQEDVGYDKPDTLSDCLSAAYIACMEGADTSYGQMGNCNVLETGRFDTLIQSELIRLKSAYAEKMDRTKRLAMIETFEATLDSTQAAWEAYRQSEMAFAHVNLGKLESTATALQLARKRYLRVKMLGLYYQLSETP